MAHNESQMRPPRLTEAQRAAIFDKVAKTVEKQYYDPNFNGTDWPRRAAEARDRIIRLVDPEEFESAVHDVVRSLGTSHTGFFHQSVRRMPSRLAIAATFHKIEMPSGPVWYAQDVHEGGPAHKAGLRPSDKLVAINGSPVTAAEHLQFAMGSTIDMVVAREEREMPIRIDIPHPKSRKQPHSQMKSVIVSKLDGNVGYLKVPVLPGMLGLDVAREIDAAMAELANCDGLVLDLRGHIGGGLGVLRLMSHLTARQVAIGYTVTRKRAERGYRKEDLPKLDQLPTHLPNPLAIASMVFKFVGRDMSTALVSEGLGEKRWHGRLSVLINEHTISAGEMVAAFVQEYTLGTLVGVQTAGRLVPSSGNKMGHGYFLVLPRAAYFGSSGSMVEQVGVPPNVSECWVPNHDQALTRAQLCTHVVGARS
jgi:C-terminal processing protease CtpA/Prc